MIPIQHRLVLNGVDSGPFSIRQLQGMWLAGTITSETQHWMEGYSEWLPLEFIRQDLEPEVVAARALPVLPGMASTMPTVAPGAPKVRVLYVVLAFFFGGLGVHNFYAGRYLPAVCQLGATLTVPMGISSIGDPNLAILFILAAAVFLIGEALLVTQDGRGQKMI